MSSRAYTRVYAPKLLFYLLTGKIGNHGNQYPESLATSSFKAVANSEKLATELATIVTIGRLPILRFWLPIHIKSSILAT